MNIKTKFNIRDVVFCVNGYEIEIMKIKKITFYSAVTLYNGWATEEDMFKTKKEAEDEAMKRFTEKLKGDTQ